MKKKRETLSFFMFSYQKYGIINEVMEGVFFMEEKLTREEVLHVANLARIKLTEEEIEKYQVELKKLLKDVEKINEVQGYDDDILIACWDQNTECRKDEEGEMLDPKQVVENAPRHAGNYIEVPVVIGESEGA